MPWGGPYTVLPKEVNYIRSAVSTGAAVITSLDTDVSQLEVTNVTSGALLITVQDGSGNALYKSVSIAANQATLLVSDPPVFFPGGVSWSASNSGLFGTVRGRTLLGLTMGSATPQSNNQPIPV